MRQKKAGIRLKKKERNELERVVRAGKQSARSITRSRILLLSDQNGKPKSNREIIEALGISPATLFNVRKRFFKEGMASIHDKPRPGQPLKFSGRVAAAITALACSSPPEGRSRWTLELLGDRAVELKLVESIHPQRVHEILKKTRSSRT